MNLKKTSFPTISTEKDFKISITKACKELGVSFSFITKKLLEKWLNGEITIELNPRDTNGFTPQKAEFLKKIGEEAKEAKNLIR